MQPNAPIDREMEQREKEKEGVKFERDYRRFSMRPYKGKEKADNRLFFACFPFNKWSWFQGWPDLAGYYLKLPIHRVQTVGDNGMPQRGMVLCEPQMNKYARETLSTPDLTVPEPFPTVKVCPFCAHSQGLWDEYKELKKAAGIVDVSKERFKELMQENPHVGEASKLAKAWGVQETFYFLVFDYSKYAGEVKLNDDEPEEMFFQAYFGPATILEGVYAAHKAKCKFWDFEGGNFRVINVNRDNTRGAQFCEYKVQAEFEQARLDAGTLNYLANPPTEDLFDPASWVETWSVEDKKNYVQAFGDGSPLPNDRGAASANGAGSTAEGEGTESDKPAVDAKSASPAARPRRLGAVSGASQAPATPPPTATAAAAPEPPLPATQESAAPPAPESSDAPKRQRVTWRR